MKKVVCLSTVLGLLALGTTNASAASVSATTPVDVTFTSSLIVPNAPEGSSKTEDNTRDNGKFGLLYVPEKLSYSDNITGPTKELELSTSGNYRVGLGDVKGDDSGWTLRAKLTGSLTNKQSNGADLSKANLKLSADTELSSFQPTANVKPTTFNKISSSKWDTETYPGLKGIGAAADQGHVDITTSEAVVSSAQKGKGYGYWDVNLKDPKLTVTSATDLKAGEYNGVNIQWDLTDAPS